jgi:hypothetical protein
MRIADVATKPANTRGATFRLGFLAMASLSLSAIAASVAPPAPTGLTARALSPTEVNLRWTPPAGTAGAPITYQLYSSGSLFGSAKSASVSVSRLMPSTTYLFSVSTCDAQKNCSAQAGPAFVTTFPQGFPSIANFTGLWWNPDESGWGMNVNHQGSTLFATLFTYDVSGRAMWLVMSSGVAQQIPTIFVGDLYYVSGPPFYANPFAPIGPGNLSPMGTMMVNFSSSAAATVTYTLNGAFVVKSVRKQIFGSRGASCVPETGSRRSLTNYQDLWWNPAESGWGVNITHQDDTLFATLFTYDSEGRDLWLVMSNGARQADGSYFGDLFQTTGPAFNAVPFTPITGANVASVGKMRFRFADGEHGTLTYTVNGTQVTKAITRQLIASPFPSCSS